MKILHLSDLHLGKRLLGFPMLEEQEYILKEILEITKEQQPQAVVIAGDVYDKGIPSVEAIDTLDNFLVELSKLNLEVFVISGNHDQAERLAFGSRLMIPNIHIAPAYNGAIKPIVLTDEFGDVNVYSLPFVKPSFVRQFAGEEVASYQRAVEFAVEQMNVDAAARNVLVAHQFVTNAGKEPEKCDSEEINVGGIENVDASTFNAFDYVALGHIHRGQQVSRQNIRYCGSPLKYSFSEINHKKSATMVELKAKGEVEVTTIPLTPKTGMSELKGSFEELTATDFYTGKDFKNHLMSITLTDEQDVPEAFGRLRNIYPNLLDLKYDNHRTRSTNITAADADVEELKPIEILQKLYKEQNGLDMDADMEEFVKPLIENIWK